MNIRDAQNSAASIDRLLAQRLLYRRAKIWRYSGLGLVVVVAFLTLTSVALDAETFTYFVSLTVAASWFADQVFIADKISSLRDEAARIQEDFDCNVLEIPWPKHRDIDRPFPDRVRTLAQAARHVRRVNSNLEDWYSPDAIPEDPFLARVHCQSMNVVWDYDLRTKWNMTIVCTSIGVATVLLTVGAFLGATLLEALVGAAMLLRIVAWVVVETRSQKRAIAQCASIRKFLADHEFLSLRSLHDVRLAQDMIFEHRRSSPTIPDSFYGLFRTRQEREQLSSH